MFQRIVNLFTNKTPSADTSENEENLKGQRFNDGVMLIKQDNATKEIVILSCNMNAQKLLGYDNSELVEQDLRRFLTEQEVEAINEFNRFEDGEKDFAEVLSKIRTFKIMRKDGEYLSMRLRVVRAISQQNAPCFQMIFNNNELKENIDKQRSEFRAKLNGNQAIDEATGLLSYESIVKDVEILSFYKSKNEHISMMVSFELLEVEENQDLSVIRTCLAAAIEICKREEDISGRIADNVMALILVDTPEENIHIPIRRVNEKFAELTENKEVEKIPQLKERFVQIAAEPSAEKQISTILP